MSASNTAKSPEGRHYQYWVIMQHHRAGAFRVTSRWVDPDARVGGSFTWDPSKTPDSLIPDWADDLHPSKDPGPGDHHARLADARGWPLLAMWSAYAANDSIYGLQDEPPRDWQQSRNSIRISDRSGWRVDFTGGHIRLLPLAILWPPFLINSVIYASGWFALVLLHRLVRLTIRSLSVKQSASLVALCTFLGVLTTIAVAWSLVTWNLPARESVNYTFTFEKDHEFDMLWTLSRRTALGRTLYQSKWEPLSRRFEGWEQPFATEEFLPRWAYFANVPKDDRDATERERAVESLGWPMRALWYGCELLPADSSQSWWMRSPQFFVKAHPLESRTGWNGRDYNYGIRAVPLGPIWIGLLIDTLVFAVGWICVFAVVLSPRTTLRARRISRGLCLICGYDIRGDSVHGCPECGWGR